jgi:hypothetical protein
LKVATSFLNKFTPIFSLLAESKAVVYLSAITELASNLHPEVHIFNFWIPPACEGVVTRVFMQSWFKRNTVISGSAILSLAFAGLFCVSLQAQTTDEGSGPSEQPSAPMEMGQSQSDQPPGHQAPMSPSPGGPPSLGQPPPGGEAQPGGPTGEAPADVKQGVGRVSLTHGAVSTQRGDSGDWSAAILNQPVVMGDKVSTGDGGRAEVQLDYANILRLGPNSQANISNFTKKFIQVQVAQGIAGYSVFGESETEPEIDTPNVAIHPAHENGVFRIEVRPDGDSIIIVRKGQAQISTPQGIANIKAGDMATVRGTGAEARYKITAAPDRDDWDIWNTDRDRMIHAANGWQHTNKYYVGSEDLDRNGRWENAPDYGQVWVPNEPQGWAPYRDGNWVWEPYYGWTWVGYEPWGWAPYHYGRWFPYGAGWAWWPGPVWGPGFYRPFWSPAYVSFFGFGGGFGFGFGGGWGGWGGFGWLPIGPGDWFHPWWGGYYGRFGVVGFDRFSAGGRFGGFAPLRGRGFSNVAHFNDPQVNRGLSTVGAHEFGSGRTSAVAASRSQLSSARMMTGNMPVVPTHASLSASGRAAVPGTIRNTESQHFAGGQSGGRTESFSQQTARLQSSMQSNHFSPMTAGGRTTESHGVSALGREGGGLGRTEAGNTRSESARAGGGETATGSRSDASRGESNRSDWKSFTPTSHSDSVNRGAEGTSRSENGSYWNRTSSGSGDSRGSGSAGEYGRSEGSRPQLNMRQPIVQPRSSGSYGGYGSRTPGYAGPGSGGSRTAPSYGGNRGGYGSGSSHGAATSGGGGHHR